ncbi:MAG: 8-amino-7-oxononanoate synthase [Bacteroidetes bacterium]|nr:8-amino-7-oxononanoate synthase [Bacteroidota bacterium]
MYNDSFLNKKLDRRLQQNAFRKLKLPGDKIDFCSNDYLGIVYHNLLNNQMNEQLKTGSTGSRLLAGNYSLIETTEKQIAEFHRADAALIFNSGYDANLGILSAVPQKGDTILYDQLCHASLRDGIRLSFAQNFSFVHNDTNDLEKKLKSASGNIFIITESVFSMDGDYCPLEELVALKKKYNAHIIVDEAHAIGVVGENGEGLTQHKNLQDEVFCRVYTFGKACGCHGAVAVGSNKLKDFLINFARSFIYTTALPEQAVAAIRLSYKIFPLLNKERKQLHQLIDIFQQANIRFENLNSFSAIQVVIVPGNDEVKNIAQQLQDHNLDVRPILYPTVPAGKERLRIVLHAFNTLQEIEQLIKILS